MHDKEEGTVNRILSYVEKTRFGIISSIIYIFILAALRSFMEGRVFNYVTYTVYLLANHIALYFALFIVGVVIIALVSGIHPRKVYNVVLLGWPIILIPPIIDYIVGQLTGNISPIGYPYSPNPSFIGTIKLFFSSAIISDAGWGEAIQLWGILIMSSLYVYLRKKSIIRALGTWLGLFLFMVYVSASIPNIISYDPSTGDMVLLHIVRYPIYAKYYSYLIPLVNPSVPPTFTTYVSYNTFQQLFLFIAFYYTVLFLVFSAIFVYISDRVRFREFMKMSDPLFLVAAAVAAFAGILSGKVLYVEYIYHQVYAGMAVLSAVSAAQVWVMLRHLSIDNWKEKSFKRKDEWKDRPFTKKQYRNVAIAFAILSIATSSLLGSFVALMSLLLMVVAYLYHCKPFQTKYSRYGPIYFSLSGILAFLIGFYTPSYWLVKIWGPTKNEYEPSMVRVLYIHVFHSFNTLSYMAMSIIFLLMLVLYLIRYRLIEKGPDEKDK